MKDKKAFEINWGKALPLLIGLIIGGIIAFFLVKTII